MRRKIHFTIGKHIITCVVVSIVPMTLVAGYFVWTGIKKDIDSAKLELAATDMKDHLRA